MSIVLSNSIDRQAVQATVNNIFSKSNVTGNKSSNTNGVNLSESNLSKFHRVDNGQTFYGKTASSDLRNLSRVNSGIDFIASQNLQNTVRLLSAQAALNNFQTNKINHSQVDSIIREEVELNNMKNQISESLGLKQANNLNKDKKGSSSNPFGALVATKSSKHEEKESNKLAFVA